MPARRCTDLREHLLELAAADQESLGAALTELRAALLASREALQLFLQTCPESLLQQAWQRAQQRRHERADRLGPQQLALDFTAPARVEEGDREVIFRADPVTGTYRATRPVTLEELHAFWQDWLEAEFFRSDSLSDVQAARRYLLARLARRDQEVFAGVFLDGRRGVLGYEELFFGTVDGVAVHNRRVVQRALARNATGLIVARNCTAGQPPARFSADERIYAQLRQSLDLIDVQLLDYFVIAGAQAISLEETTGF